MNRIKLFSLIYMTIVGAGSALAFKTIIFHQGSLYCSRSADMTTCSSRIDYKIDPSGAVNAPCGVDINSSPLPVYIQETPSNCVQVPAGTHYSPTSF